jgi:hypothetical protein
MSFLFLRLFSSEDNQEAFIYKRCGAFQILGFQNAEKEYLLEYYNEDKLLTLIDLFFRRKFEVKLYCVRDCYFDRFKMRFHCMRYDEIQDFVRNETPRQIYDEENDTITLETFLTIL